MKKLKNIKGTYEVNISSDNSEQSTYRLEIKKNEINDLFFKEILRISNFTNFSLNLGDDIPDYAYELYTFLKLRLNMFDIGNIFLDDDKLTIEGLLLSQRMPDVPVMVYNESINDNSFFLRLKRIFKIK